MPKTHEHRDGKGSSVQRLVLLYLQKKYGGNVAALKPPLGWYFYAPLWRRIKYYPKLWAWKADCNLFKRYGDPMRKAWGLSWKQNAKLNRRHEDR